MITGDKIKIEWRVIPGQRGHREVIATLHLEASVQVTLGDNPDPFRKNVESDLRDAILETLYGPKDIPVALRDNPEINGDNNPIR